MGNCCWRDQESRHLINVCWMNKYALDSRVLYTVKKIIHAFFVVVQNFCFLNIYIYAFVTIHTVT